MNRQLFQTLEYILEQERVVREQLKGKKLRFTDDQRRRLAAKARVLDRKVLQQLETIVTPDTRVQSRWCHRFQHDMGVLRLRWDVEFGSG